ncbi:hypothetical protein F5883DRAFT_549927 [Diaporthe sp. PMI_573]|nr:hypothetical protein F5883DRAFT_549927 [Diaporthaceae sp. PMI_573]
MPEEEFPEEDIPEEEFPEEEFPEEEEGEGDGERDLDEEALEDAVDDDGEFDGEGEEDDDDEGLDDEALQDIMNDSAPGSPTGSENERGLDSPGMEEELEEPENEEGPEGEAEAEEQPDEPEDTNDVRMSQLYRQSAVMFSPILTSPLPPSPPPEQDTTSPQDEEPESTDPIRFSHLYRQSINLDMAMTIQSPNSDGGLSAIAESPGMEQGQSFDVPVIMAPVPDFAKRRSERMSARMSTMSQPLSPIAASPLSPRPLATPPPEEDETYDEAEQPQYDPNYDVERAISPEEEYDNYYDEDDEYEPHNQRDSGPGGPQTFDDMNLSPRPGPSPSERYSYHEDLEQGPPMTPFTPNGNRKTLRERMSGWWAQGNGDDQQSSGQPRTPPPPMPYDSGQFI